MSLSQMERPVTMSPEAVDTAFAGQVELYNAEAEQKMWADVGAAAIESSMAPTLSSEQHQTDQAYEVALEAQLDATFGPRA